jgi:hypothetical protein
MEQGRPSVMDTIGRVYVVGRKVKYSMLLKLNGASKAT